MTLSQIIVSKEIYIITTSRVDWINFLKNRERRLELKRLFLLSFYYFDSLRENWVKIDILFQKIAPPISS